ncbi:hypothetical protein Bbelb_029820 [Branchiostoma belcheri]|nr:hypothetical protein Bbelb_029820 [Branchiostoma belcheri]
MPVGDVALAGPGRAQESGGHRLSCGSVQDIVREAAGYLPCACRRTTNKGDKMPLKQTFNCDHYRARREPAGATSPTGTGAIGTEALDSGTTRRNYNDRPTLRQKNLAAATSQALLRIKAMQTHHERDGLDKNGRFGLRANCMK